MRGRCKIVAAFLVAGWGTAGPALGSSEPERSAVMLASFGFSRSLDFPARNLAPPTAELRLGHRLSELIEPDVGLALIAFPEVVPELRVGVRLRPFGTLAVPVLRSLFVRPGAHALLATGAGFEWGIGGEGGIIIEEARLIAYAALAGTRVLRHPRVLAEARMGFGFRF